MAIGAKEWTQSVISVRAAADINDGVIVKLDGNGDVVACSAITDIPFGVTRDKVKAGDTAAVVVAGIASVKAGGTITIGGLVGSGATGLGTTIVAGTATTVYIVGQATEAAVTGDLFAVRLILAGRAA